MAGAVTAAVHPSAILRAPDSDQRHTDYEAFVNDLKSVRRKLSKIAYVLVAHALSAPVGTLANANYLMWHTIH
jgi:hypothetical protein